MKRRLAVVSMAVVAIGGLLGAASADARLDPGFGENGVVTLVGLNPGGSGAENIEAIATGQNGETYVVVRQTGCWSLCQAVSAVYRFQANGTRQMLWQDYEIPPLQRVPGRVYETGSSLVTV